MSYLTCVEKERVAFGNILFPGRSHGHWPVAECVSPPPSLHHPPSPPPDRAPSPSSLRHRSIRVAGTQKAQGMEVDVTSKTGGP